MSKLPTLRTKYGEGVGVEIYCSFPDILSNQKTYLDADAAVGASALTADGINFAVSQYGVLGQQGAIKTEIVQLHASTAPTATTVTLAAVTSFAHNRGDILQFIPYNQIVLSTSPDGITYTDQSAVPIRADSTETYIQRPSDTSAYFYKFKFLNSTTSAVSAYSDIVPATGYADNTIGAVKRRALSQLGEEIGDLISDQFLNDSIQEARRVLDQNPAIFRWSFRTKFGAVWGQVMAGQWRVAVPADLRDQNTNKNILSLRPAAQNRPLVYQDQRMFNQNYLNVVHSTNPNTVTFGATSVVLSSTHDFSSPAGSVTVAGNTPGQGLTVITYTGNNLSTNTLSGCTWATTPSSGSSFNVGTDFWQNMVFGLPTAYCINAGYVYFDTPMIAKYDGMDLKGDYYSTIPGISTDDQAFDEPFYDLYVPYLKFKIKYKKANGKIDRDNDTDWKDWMTGMASIVGQETPGQRMRFVPDVEGFLSATE